MSYRIDGEVCITCGAYAGVCPVDCIAPVEQNIIKRTLTLKQVQGFFLFQNIIFQSSLKSRVCLKFCVNYQFHNLESK